MTTAYPLSWPDHIPRAKARDRGAFKTSLAGALNNVKKSLRMFAQDSGIPAADAVISSNVTLGMDSPRDPGVAVWFVWDGVQVCIPVDRYQTVAANLQAIHHIIEARRVELRHGTLALVRATFKGFQALPAPARKEPWRRVFGVDWITPPTKAMIEERYKILAKRYHPDAPDGSTEKMAAINVARDEALKEIGQ